MIFYHGTSKDSWEMIQQEGVLYGRRYVIDGNGTPIKEVSRCTYLAVELNEAKCYGEVVLQVEYDPFINSKDNNYVDGCWQMRVYEPITIDKIKVITDEDCMAASEDIINAIASENAEKISQYVSSL